jgi:hypothetical protein
MGTGSDYADWSGGQQIIHKFGKITEKHYGIYY